MSHKIPPNKATKESFIEKAKKKHGDNKFDYSKVVYKTCKDKVIITCNIDEHGEFETTPDSHLQSQGACQKCRYKTISSKKKKTQELFISQAMEKHENTYDYSEVIYVNHNTKVKIICKDHGAFEQKAGNHLRGDGCIKCAGIYTPSTDEWIEKAKRKHGNNKFDYSNVKYINANTEVIIGCITCGKDFKQTPTSHIMSEIGCDWCRKKHVYTTEEFIEEARKIHGDRYDYSKTHYVSATSPVIIRCTIHGDFNQTPSDHKNQGSGCKKCSNVYSPTTNEWIVWAKNIWGDTYDYSKVDYKYASEKVTIICNKHGEFNCSPNNHIHATNPTGCPSCVRKGEGMIAEYLLEQKIDFIKECKLAFLTNKRMDYYLKNKNICIEIDGLQHFKQVWNWKSPEEQVCNDIEKMKLCLEHGLSIVRIYQPFISVTHDRWKIYINNAIKMIKDVAYPIIIFSEIEEYNNHKILCDKFSLKYLTLC
jgi:very-short-patch-repair endonuclease